MKGIRLTSKGARQGLTPSIRIEILDRDNYTCQYCGAKAPLVKLEVDHIKPIGKGGKTIRSNLITSCSSCNRGKYNKLLVNAPVLKDIEDYKQASKQKTTILFELFDKALKVKRIVRNTQSKKVLQDCINKHGFEKAKQKVLKATKQVVFNEETQRLEFKTAIDAFKTIAN